MQNFLRNHIASDGSNVGSELAKAIRKIRIDNMDEFTRAYIECAIWDVCNPDNPEFDGKGEDDLAPETLGAMIADCQKFQTHYSGLLKAAYMPRYDEDSTGKEYQKEEYTPHQAGHDFWLSRNGHGAGFFDRGLGEIGDQLQSACGWRTAFDTVELYLGDDGKIYA